MLKASGKLIDLGYLHCAERQLKAIAKKTDGEKRPPDFVVGDNVANLNAMVDALIVEIQEEIDAQQ